MPRPTTFTSTELKFCPGCTSDLGPFKSSPDCKPQIVCSTCGMRGPYATKFETAEQLWNGLPRVVAQPL